MSLRLLSNNPQPVLEGVGSAALEGDKISLTVFAGSSGFVLRNGNLVKLLEVPFGKSSVKGEVKLGDIYLLGKTTLFLGKSKEDIKSEYQNNENVLVLKVEEEKESGYTPKPNITINNASFNDATSTQRKTTLTVGIIILALLLVSVFFGMKQKKLKEFNTKSEAKLTQAISDFDASTASLNKEEARGLFLSAKETAEDLKKNGYKNAKLDELLEKINSSEASLLGEMKTDVQEFLDLTLQTSGFNGSQMASSGEEMFILDKENKNVIQVGIENKKAKIKAGSGTLGDINQIAAYEERLFTLDEKGLYEIENGKEKLFDSDWGNSLFYVYAGNIYLVDKDNNQVYRFSGSASGFASKSDWLAPGIEADFSKVKDITIDGSIWLISTTGKVSRFSNGNPITIGLNGITKQLDDPTAVYTNENLKNVYVLDAKEGRVVVLEKNGNFKLQYVSDSIKQAKDLVVSEKEGKVILLNGPKLMYFKLESS